MPRSDRAESRRFLLAGAFVVAACLLSAISALFTAAAILRSDVPDALLLGGIAIFAAWMATAILQFQRRLAAIDEVVREGRHRVERSEFLLAEMKRLVERNRSGDGEEESQPGRILH